MPITAQGSYYKATGGSWVIEQGPNGTPNPSSDVKPLDLSKASISESDYGDLMKRAAAWIKPLLALAVPAGTTKVGLVFCAAGQNRSVVALVVIQACLDCSQAPPTMAALNSVATSFLATFGEGLHPKAKENIEGLALISAP